jgi:hypothetical protein
VGLINGWLGLTPIGARMPVFTLPAALRLDQDEFDRASAQIPELTA